MSETLDTISQADREGVNRGRSPSHRKMYKRPFSWKCCGGKGEGLSRKRRCHNIFFGDVIWGPLIAVRVINNVLFLLIQSCMHCRSGNTHSRHCHTDIIISIHQPPSTTGVLVAISPVAPFPQWPTVVVGLSLCRLRKTLCEFSVLSYSKLTTNSLFLCIYIFRIGLMLRPLCSKPSTVCEIPPATGADA